MAVSAGFQNFVLDLLSPLQPSARRLFGGVGLMMNGSMFALLSRDELYLRVDDRTRLKFEAAGCAPFGYNRAGKNVIIGTYYAVPATLYDDPDELITWAKEAIAVAERRAQKSGIMQQRPPAGTTRKPR